MVAHECGPGQFTQWQPAVVILVTAGRDGRPAGCCNPGRVTSANMASDEAYGVCHSQQRQTGD